MITVDRSSTSRRPLTVAAACAGVAALVWLAWPSPESADRPAGAHGHGAVRRAPPHRPWARAPACCPCPAAASRSTRPACSTWGWPETCASIWRPRPRSTSSWPSSATTRRRGAGKARTIAARRAAPRGGRAGARDGAVVPVLHAGAREVGSAAAPAAEPRGDAAAAGAGRRAAPPALRPGHVERAVRRAGGLLALHARRPGHRVGPTPERRRKGPASSTRCGRRCRARWPSSSPRCRPRRANSTCASPSCANRVAPRRKAGAAHAGTWARTPPRASARWMPRTRSGPNGTRRSARHATPCWPRHRRTRGAAVEQLLAQLLLGGGIARGPGLRPAEALKVVPANAGIHAEAEPRAGWHRGPGVRRGDALLSPRPAGPAPRRGARPGCA